MRLLEAIVDELEHLDDGLTICAAKSPTWSRKSEAELCPADDVPLKCKLPYFLEVAVAKTVLSAWSYARNGQLPNLHEKCEAIIYYAENDAYLLPE